MQSSASPRSPYKPPPFVYCPPPSTLVANLEHELNKSAQILEARLALRGAGLRGDNAKAGGVRDNERATRRLAYRREANSAVASIVAGHCDRRLDSPRERIERRIERASTAAALRIDALVKTARIIGVERANRVDERRVCVAHFKQKIDALKLRHFSIDFEQLGQADERLILLEEEEDKSVVDNPADRLANAPARRYNARF